MVLIIAVAAAAAVPAVSSAGSVELGMHLGRPMVFIDGRPEPLPAYSPLSCNRARFTAQMAHFTPHRMGLYFLGPLGRNGFPDPFWQGDTIAREPLANCGEGFDDVDQPANMTLVADPGARFMIRFFTHEPASWRSLHPDQLFVADDGTVQQSPSLASDLYWSAATNVCANMIRYFETRSWADRIIGYANFGRVEGTHEPAIGGWLFDHSAVMQVRWKTFLERKYGSLREARKVHGGELAEGAIPVDRLRGKDRDAANALYWRRNPALSDYLELQRDLFHLRYRQMCEAMHAAAKRRVIFLHDALKQSMQGWDNIGFFDAGVSRNGARADLCGASGSIGVAPLLELPGADGLITPHDYQARGPGGVFEPEGAADSIVLRGRLFLCEMDTRTYANDRSGRAENDFGAARNLKEYEAIAWRNLATAWTRGFGVYWMDMYTDWFAAADLQPAIRRQVEAIRESVNWEHATVPGIAMIVDDTAILETDGSGGYLAEAVMQEWKGGLARCGVPFRIYLFEDLQLSNFPPHRVFYFPNLFRVTEERLAVLRQRVFRDGNVVVWGPGSGISDGERIGVASVKRLTGFECFKADASYPHRALISDFGHPITRGLAADTIIGSPLSYGPLLFPTNGRALAAAWTKVGWNRIGLAVLEMGKGARGIYSGAETLGAGDYASVFTTAVPLTADLWRNLARYGGAHVYVESNDVLLADSTIVALHSLKSEKKIIHLPGTFTVFDVVTGKRIAAKVSSVEFDLEAPATRVFRLVK